MPDSLHAITGFIGTLAEETLLTPDSIRSQATTVGLSSWGERLLTKTIVSLAKDLRLRGQLGRLRAAVLLGASLAGDRFVTTLERTGVLLAEVTMSRSLAVSWRSFMQMLQKLPTGTSYRNGCRVTKPMRG